MKRGFVSPEDLEWLVQAALAEEMSSFSGVVGHSPKKASPKEVKQTEEPQETP